METKKAKIICTIGPASDSLEMLTKLANAGMNIARLNFSHGTHEEHLQKIKRIRKVSRQTGKIIAILQDLQGPKIRVGKFENPPIQLNPGDLFTLTTEDIQGNAHIVSTSYKKLADDVQIDDEILVNDGLIKLKVQYKKGKDIFCEVVNGGSLYDRRGINLPGVKVSEPSLTAKDKRDLKFGLEHGVDYVALSFVRDAESILQVKKIIGKHNVPVIAKLEKPEALENLDAIIEATDAVMVARGDLGVEIAASKVPVVQKHIIEKCLLAGKPVITATQMLDSMMVNPVATRAETSDVANAVFDGSDAVMLSGETAFGKYPLDSVKYMASIIRDAESNKTYFRKNLVLKKNIETPSFSHSVCQAAYYSAKETNATWIIVFTESGRTAQMMSNLRPLSRILALSGNKEVLNRMALLWGVTPSLITKRIEIVKDLSLLETYLKDKELVSSGDNVVIMAGSSKEEGGTNMLRLHQIS